MFLTFLFTHYGKLDIGYYIYIYIFQIYLLDDFYNDSDCQLFLYFFHCPVIVTHASTMLLIFKLVFKASKGFCPY